MVKGVYATKEQVKNTPPLELPRNVQRDSATEGASEGFNMPLRYSVTRVGVRMSQFSKVLCVPKEK